jgi:serine/threonine protein kinase
VVWYVVCYRSGGSLHERIHGKGQPAVSVMETLQIAKDIATGLMFMHPEVVHRDIKPDNILLEKGGRAKIIGAPGT